MMTSFSKVAHKGSLHKGPGVGSFLYSVGGFGLPFWTTGGICILASFLIFFFLPNIKSTKSTTTDSDELSDKRVKTLSYKEIVKVIECNNYKENFFIDFNSIN